MNRLLAVFAMFFAGFFAIAEVAEAKRMGGGRSFGAQRQATPASPPTANVAPGAPAAAAASKAAPAAAGGSRWMGPLAGLAAGLGIAALLSHLGLSEGFASFLLLALIVIGGVLVVRMLLARRAPARSPLQYAGTGPGLGNTPGGYETSPAPQAAANSRFEPVLAGTGGVAPAAPAQAGPQFGRIPPGFNAAPFVEQAKLQFGKLQAAYDSGDRKALSEVMTPEMYAEIAAEVAGRGAHVPTEVVHLDAELLEVKEEGSRYWASVHFRGRLREDGSILPKDFEEIWNLVKPVDGSSGWLLAGIEQVGSA